jgi:hypothetical protein
MNTSGNVALETQIKELARTVLMGGSWGGSECKSNRRTLPYSVISQALVLEPKCVCVCVCMCERKRERERERKRERERERKRERDFKVIFMKIFTFYIWTLGYEVSHTLPCSIL